LKAAALEQKMKTIAKDVIQQTTKYNSEAYKVESEIIKNGIKLILDFFTLVVNE